MYKKLQFHLCDMPEKVQPQLIYSGRRKPGDRLGAGTQREELTGEGQEKTFRMELTYILIGVMVT